MSVSEKHALARFSDWSALSEGDRRDAAGLCRTRLHTIGRKLNAVVHEFPDRPAVQGTLAGFPYVAKDMIATGLTAPTWGCATPPEGAGEAASIILRLGEAGASLVATAEMTELAYEPSGFNAGRGKVLNPWNREYAAGGSSSGSSALVAAGCCYAALGSDTGGSVRIPAHCCGVTALKPTWGGIAVDGTMPLAPSLDTIGVIARSASDIAPLWTVLSERRAVQPAGRVAKATVLEEAMANSDPEIARHCSDAIGVLGRLGMAIAARHGFPEDADRSALLVMQAEAARAHQSRMEEERIDAVLRKRLGKGLAISDHTLAAALAGRFAAQDEFLSYYLGDADMALLPVMPICTPRYAETEPSSPEFQARTLYAMSRFTRFVNYLGLPALAVPVGFDRRGMPVAMQMIGRPGTEVLLLDTAMRLQAETDWHARLPAGIGQDTAFKEGFVA